MFTSENKKPRQRRHTDRASSKEKVLQMNTINSTAIKTAAQQVWMLDFSGELVNESRTESRSADGRFLKKHCKLTTKRRSSDFNEMLAAESFENEA